MAKKRKMQTGDKCPKCGAKMKTSETAKWCKRCGYSKELEPSNLTKRLFGWL